MAGVFGSCGLRQKPASFSCINPTRASSTTTQPGQELSRTGLPKAVRGISGSIAHINKRHSLSGVFFVPFLLFFVASLIHHFPTTGEFLPLFPYLTAVFVVSVKPLSSDFLISNSVQPLSVFYTFHIYNFPTLRRYKPSIVIMGVLEQLSRKAGVITGDDVLRLFEYAQEQKFALPAIVSHPDFSILNRQSLY